jgi:putative addiction module antidote
MIQKLKVTQIGNSVGVVLPKELLAKLRVDKGDTLRVTETPRGVELTAYYEEFATQMELAERIMRLFLFLLLLRNGMDITATKEERYQAMLGLAAGEFTAESFAARLRDHSAELEG